MKVMNILARIFGRDWGTTHLKHGKHKFFVPTRIVPDRVWTSFTKQVSDGCGNSPRDSVSYKLTKCGIDFEVDVQSDRCHFEWFAAE